MSEFRKFLGKVPRWSWLVLAALFLVICALPALFTQFSWFIDFYDTGTIGDTIGGIMGPFIAIIAALLTFIAFVAQFEANIELKQENKRNHFESRFYKMLDMHLDNVKHLKSVSSNDSSAFCGWCDEINNSFNELILEADSLSYLMEMRVKYKDDPDRKELLAFIHDLETSKPDLHRVMFEIAYRMFYSASFADMTFNGISHSSAASDFAFLFTTLRVEKKREKNKKQNNEQEDNKKEFYAKNEILGRYYRHLFQIVKYVDDKEDTYFEEKNWKEEYISLLRSQMSDYEQVLLYYNAQSSLGSAWNEKHYIERYKLIKNIPSTMIRSAAGIAPCKMYKDAIEKAKANGENFFEWE